MYAEIFSDKGLHIHESDPTCPLGVSVALSHTGAVHLCSGRCLTAWSCALKQGRSLDVQGVPVYIR